MTSLEFLSCLLVYRGLTTNHTMVSYFIHLTLIVLMILLIKIIQFGL